MSAPRNGRGKPKPPLDYPAHLLPPPLREGEGSPTKRVERWAHSLCLQLPEATLDHPFGPEADVFRIRGKMFALLAGWFRVAPGPILNLKAEVDEVPRLIATHAFIHPAFHMNKRHWVSVSFMEHTDLDLVASLVEDSYDNVVLGLPASRRPFGAHLPILSANRGPDGEPRG